MRWKITTNRKVRYNFEIIETLEAGIVLKGTEVRSLRNGSVNITQAFCKIIKGEIWLINSQISHYPFAGSTLQHNTTRDRKLLLNRKEIKRWNLDVDRKRLSIVPTRIFFSKRLAKIEIALVRGKRKYDRRQSIKNKEAEIEIKRSLKRSMF